MKKIFLFSLAIASISLWATAQGSLQFNDIKLISNTPTAVPSGKIWKVMAVYGKQADQCVVHPNIDPTSWYNVKYWSYKTRGFQVNGQTVWQNVSEATFGVWNNASCTSSYTTVNWTNDYAMGFKNEIGHQTPDDLAAMLPFWLPAGATLNSMAANQYISVMEFNVIP